MLPYIEQDNLFKLYNYQYAGSTSNPYGKPIGPDPNPNPNREVAKQLVKTYQCPSDAIDPSSYLPRSTDFYERDVPQRSNYLFATGSFTDYSAWYGQYAGDIRRGPFGNNGAASIASIPDGTSNTIAIGESRNWKTSTHYGPYWGTGTHTAVHGYTPSNSSTTVAPAATHARDYNVNAPYQARADGKVYAWVFSSSHSGGANFVFLDGSVRFLANGTNYTTFCAMTYVADGTPLANQ